MTGPGARVILNPLRDYPAYPAAHAHHKSRLPGSQWANRWHRLVRSRQPTTGMPRTRWCRALHRRNHHTTP